MFGRRPLRRALFFGALAALVAVGSSCTAPAPGPMGSGSPTVGPQQRRPLTVGMGSDIPGFNLLLSPETNDRAGFDYDVTNWLGDNTTPGFVPTPSPVKLSERESFLREGRVDLVVDILSITPERRAGIGIAGPYLLTREGFMTRRGEPTVDTLDQLTGLLSVCTVRGTTSEIQLTPYQRQGRIALTSVDGARGCAERLRSREVAVFSLDQLALEGVSQQKDNVDQFTVSGFTFGAVSQYGIGYPRGDLATCRMLTDGIRKMIVDAKWDDFFRKNFPTLDPNDGHRPKPDTLDRCD